MLYVVAAVVAFAVIVFWLFALRSQNPEDRWRGKDGGQGG